MPVTRRQLNYDFVRDGSGQGFLDPLFTFTRASTATRFNASGVLETVAANVPRFDFDPVTLACRGLLVEEARTNYALNTESTTGWASSGPSLVSNAFFGKAGVRITFDEALYGDAPNKACSLSAGAGTRLTGSLYVDLSTISVTADIVVGVLVFDSAVSYANLRFDPVSKTITSYVNYRSVSSVVGRATQITTNIWRLELSVTFDESFSTARLNAYLHSTGGQIVIGLPQLEAGSFATSYIPTTTAAATRAVETCGTTQMTPWYAPNWTLGIEGSSFAPNSSFPLWLTLEASGSGFLYVGKFPDGLGKLVLPAGALAGAAITLGAVTKFGASFNGSAAKYTQDGSALQSLATTMPTPTALRLGAFNSGGSNAMNGHIRRLVFLPFAVDDYTLKAMTQ